MSQCIQLGCKREAWASETRKSYFCLEHAWTAVSGQLVFVPGQWAIFNKEGFIDALVPEECGYGKRNSEAKLEFPTRTLVRKAAATPKLRKGYENTCMRCEKPIVQDARFCGGCRKELGLPLDEARETTQRCQHWRREPSAGHLYLRNCEVDVVVSRLVDVHGERWCPACRAYVLGIDRLERLKNGYSF